MRILNDLISTNRENPNPPIAINGFSDEKTTQGKLKTALPIVVGSELNGVSHLFGNNM